MLYIGNISLNLNIYDNVTSGIVRNIDIRNYYKVCMVINSKKKIKNLFQHFVHVLY